MSITLIGVDPTRFNVIASLVAEIMMLAAAHSLSRFFKHRLSLYLRRGNKVPVSGLGRLPSGLLEALEVGGSMKWAPPAILIFLLFLFDYSTTIAFAGLGFTQVAQSGAQSPVLSLETNRRNLDFPYEVIGDPVNARTISKLEVLLDVDDQASEQLVQVGDKELLELDEQEEVLSAMFGAVDAVARGESVFLVPNDASNDGNDNDSMGVNKNSPFFRADQNSGTTVLMSKTDSSFLTAIDTIIPLNCHQEDPVLQINQVRGNKLDFATTSVVANCDYTAFRSSGIFWDDELDADEQDAPHRRNRAEVTSYVGAKAGTAASPFALYLQGQAETPITSEFSFPPNGFPMARDRLNWREGRSVFGFWGVKYKGVYDIPFGWTVVAAGRALPDTRREYTLVSQVDNPNACSDADPGPGNKSADCFVLTTLQCDMFETDKDDKAGALQNAICSPDYVQVVWMNEHFKVDKLFITAVAGVYGRNGAWALTSRQRRTLALNAAPAALFGLATIDTRASIELVDSTTIDTIFIVFMSIPVVLCLATGALFLLGRKTLLPIPDSGYSMLLLGAESAQGGKKIPEDGKQVHLRARAKPTGTASIYAPPLEYSFQSTERSSSSGSFVDEEKGEDLGHDSEAQIGLSFVVKSGREQDGSCGGDDEGSSHSADQSMASIGNTQPFWKDVESRNVVLGMLFCFALVICGAVIIMLKDESQGGEASGVVKEGSTSATNDERIPPECFRDKFELGTAVAKVLDGTTAERDQVIELHGPIESWCLHHVQDLSYVFAARLTFEEDVENWDVSAVKDFSYLFSGCSQRFRANLSSWNTSLGTSFRGTFEGANVFDGDIAGWNMESAVDLAYMFRGVGNFDQNLSSWITSGVKSLSHTFAGTDLFKGDGLSKWDVSNCEDFSHMFDGAAAFNHNLTNWKMSNAKNCSQMFFRAESFNGDVSQWDVSSVETFREMFSGDTSGLNSFNGDLSEWDTSSARDMSFMFYRSDTFAGNVSAWNTHLVEDFTYMFFGTDINSDVSRWNVSSGQRFESMFGFCGEFNSDLSQWDTSSGIDFSGMFFLTKKLNTSLSEWDVGNGIDFTNMFYGAEIFESDLSKWDVSKATSLRRMFQDTTSFNSDISGWQTRNVYDFSFMFNRAGAFNQDISSWNVESGVAFGCMFCSATSFNQNLCAWRDKMPKESAEYFAWAASIFTGTSCQSEEISDLYMCGYCPPTPAPTQAPSMNPTMSLVPSASSAPSMNPTISSAPSVSAAPTSFWLEEMVHQTPDDQYWITITGFFMDIENTNNQTIQLTKLSVHIRYAGTFYAYSKPGSGEGFTTASSSGNWTMVGVGPKQHSVNNTDHEISLRDTNTGDGIVLEPGKRHAFHLWNDGEIFGARGQMNDTWAPYSGNDDIMVMHNLAVDGLFSANGHWGQYNANRIRVSYQVRRQ